MTVDMLQQSGASGGLAASGQPNTVVAADPSTNASNTAKGAGGTAGPSSGRRASGVAAAKLVKKDDDLTGLVRFGGEAQPDFMIDLSPMLRRAQTAFVNFD